MALAKITVLGLEMDKKSQNDSIFGSLTLPSGYNSEDVQNAILLECGEFEALYADADFFKEAVSIWGKKWYHTFDKWLTALNLEYNPLENYDRQEDFTDTGTTTGNTELHTSGNTGSTTENKKSAYDSSDYSPNALATSNDSNNQDSNGSSSGTNENVRSGRIHGNVGVTTSQQMLESELKLAEWNLYNHIADIFKSELCIAVYD